MSLSSSAPGPAESILSTLNQAQCRAVTSKAATVAILAGPGSGKTHTLTSRVVWLIDNAGYKPQDVIVATFTVKAAREMKERIGKALGQGRERKIVLGTFHSIARRYLAAYGKRIGLDEKFGIADDSDSRAIIQRIIKRLQLALDPPAARSWISKRKAKGTDEPSSTRPNGKQARENPDLQTCFREYQDHLERSHLLDYDDLLTKCVELLRRFPSCVSNVQSVLIDEYQDTNGIQYELMKLFAQTRECITIVGDPDQSIYGWRSAEIKNLFRLLRDYPGTDEVSLEENYRSSQAILSTSLRVIQQDKKRYQKTLRPTHQSGTRPVLRRLRTAAIEAEWIVGEIRRIVLMSGQMMNHDDVAVLLRSAALSRHVEAALAKLGIPYKMVGGLKFYDRAEVKILIDYLRLINQPDNNDALSRVINVPRRGIGDATVKALLEEAEVSKMSVWSLLTKHCRGDRKAKTNIKKAMEQKISGELIKLVTSLRKKIEEPPAGSSCYHLVDLIQNLLSQINFQKYLQDTYPEEHENRWANVQEFTNLAADFMRDLSANMEEQRLPEIDGLDQVQETDALGKFLSNVALASDAQKGDADSKPVVTISTIHAAKGLEWPIVFVPAVYNGSIPHARSEDLDEERRLLYVAMTRAKSLLYLSSPQYGSQALGGGSEQTELSRFIPSEVQPYFARRGPSFNTDVINEIGQILGRQGAVPSAEEIFKTMPLMERLEDDLQPVDPDEANNGTKSAKRGQWQRRPKGPQGSAEEDKSLDLPSAYRATTTMEASSHFTMSSLPGFTTAGAHQTAMLAAAKDVVASMPSRDHHASAKFGTRRGTTKRTADQQSLLSFVSKRQKSDTSERTSHDETLPPTASMTVSRRTPIMSLVPSAQSDPRGSTQSIAPTLASHKLGSNKMPRPTKAATTDRTAPGPRPHYPNFSSSPTRETSPDQDKEPIDPNVVPLGARERPASCLHVTTTMPQSLGGFSRPATLKKDGGIAPIDRLRKPFKPLTLNRVGGGR